MLLELFSFFITGQLYKSLMGFFFAEFVVPCAAARFLLLLQVNELELANPVLRKTLVLKVELEAASLICWVIDKFLVGSAQELCTSAAVAAALQAEVPA
jgi:hypothetical protein